jgi:predicted TIM-barrel fold metal-dependent hydrolase
VDHDQRQRVPGVVDWSSHGTGRAGRILFATDYPFDFGPAFLPTPESGILSRADLDKVYRGNAERIFRLNLT